MPDAVGEEYMAPACLYVRILNLMGLEGISNNPVVQMRTALIYHT